MPYFYSTLLNFAVVVFIVWYFVRKPANAFLKTRSSTLGDLIRKAAASSQESAVLLNQWQTKFNQKEEEISLQKSEAKNILARLKKLSGENTVREEERIRREAELFTKSEWTRAIQGIEHRMLDQSIGMAREHFEENFEEKDRLGLIQDYMEHAGNGKRQ